MVFPSQSVKAVLPTGKGEYVMYSQMHDRLLESKQLLHYYFAQQRIYVHISHCRMIAIKYVYPVIYLKSS